MQKSNEENKALIAERVKSARAMARLKQSDVAEKLGLTPQAISNYERGVNSIPNNVIQQMAVLYRTSTDYLLGAADSWAYFDDAAMDILGDDAANVPARYSECINHLCTAVQASISFVAKNIPQLLPNADDCIYAAIECFCNLSDSFLEAGRDKFDSSQYRSKAINEITKMALCFYDYYEVTNQALERLSEKKNPTDD